LNPNKFEITTAAPIGLLLASGEQLRIPHDAATLKLVLAALREPSILT
jgi:hypothetical protein